MPKIYDNLLIIGGKNQIPLLVFTQSNYDPILYVAETGNVGIGLTPSHYRFEVSGTVSTNGFRMPTGATSGYVLTSFDNEGNANWQAPKIRKYFVSGFTFSENVTRTINHNLGTEGISVTLWDNINDTNISGLLSNRTNDSVDITLTSDFPFPGVDVIITGADSTGQDSVIMPTDLAVDDLTIEIYNNKIRLKQNVDVAYDYSDNVVARQFSGSIQHGSANSATGQNSHAEGYNTTASGTGSHAEGYKSNSIGQSSHAEGGSYINDENGGTSIGDGSHAEGFNTTTLGYGSHAEGFGTVTGIPNDDNENYYSHAEGIISKAYARGSHAEGYNTTVIENSWFGHSEGYETVVGGLGGGHSEGWKTTVLGDSSHTEGSHTITVGNWSHAEGHYTTSVGTYSHSEGINTTSSSDGSHAEGHSNLAGIRKFDCYINNGLVRIINGVDYTPDFTSGVVLLSNGLTYSYSTSSCTYSTPVFSFQLDDTSFMTSTETDFFNYEAGQMSNIRAILYTPNSIFNNFNQPSPNNAINLTSYAFGGNRYTAGITMNLNLKLVVTNFDNDFPDLLTITVPNGWKINSASPYIGLESWNYNGITYSVYDYYNDPNFWNNDGPPKGEPFMGLSNNDKTATWGFNNDVYGGIWNYIYAASTWFGSGDVIISPDGTYDIVLNVTIDEWVSGIQTLNFFLSTSSYDTDLTNGVLNLQPEGLWVVDSSNLANIKGTPIGNGSHAEGFQTTSIGDYSHTSGIGTIAMSEGQFSIGKWNTATNSNSLFTIGNGTSSSNRSDLAIFKEDSITFNKSLILKDGTHGSGKILVSDVNGVASWTFSSSLFETNGIVGDGTPNYLSKFTGTNSISDSQIFDDGSTVTIRSGLQIGSASVVSGAYGFAEGYQTTALGTGSHAEGYRSTAIGDCSHAEGGSQLLDDMGNTSIGHGSHAEGINTTSVGNYSHSEGEGTESIGVISHAEGSGTTTYGWFSHAEGNATIAYGEGSHSEGLLTKSIGNSSHSEGIWTLSIGNSSHSEGNTNVVAYSNSHVEGMYNVVGKAYKSFDYDNLLKKLKFSGNIVSEFSIGDTLDFINTNQNPYDDYDNIFIGLTISSVTFSSPNTEIVINTALGIGYNGFTFTVVNRTKSIDSGLLSSHTEGINNIAFGNGSHAEGYNTISIGTYSHSEGIGTIAYSEGQHAIGKWNTATNSTDLFVIGNGTSDLNRSDLAKFATDSITFNKSLILKDGTQGPGKILVSDSNGLASWTASSSSSNINIGNVLYVSKNGNDSTASKGRIDKPWVSIQSARNSASSGDVIYVLPGTWTYDNRDSIGNQYNGVVDSMVNLWKDGVTYYFSPGTKIIIYNQTVTGADMYLFRPNSGAFSKCSVLGHLEFEQYSTGTDTYNGRCHYLLGSVASTDYGYEFYSETKSLKSECSELILYDRSTSLTNTTKITIISDYEEVTYIDGQSGSGSAYRIRHIGTDNLVLTTSVRKRRYAKMYAHYYTTNNKTRIEMNSEEIYIVGGTNGGTYMPQTGALESGELFLFYESTGGQINCYSGVIYYCTARINWHFGAIVTSIGGGNWSMNIKADLIDSNANSHSTGMFYIISGSCSLNFGGNIVTNTNDKQNGSWFWAGNDNNGLYGGTVPAGRFIAYTNASNTTINIKGDIDFIGTETTRNSLFQSNGGSVINYTGKIKGNFAGTLAKTFNGTVNILDSYVMSVIASSDAMIAKNGGTYSGTFRMSNSYIQLKNDTYTMCNGSYVKTLINNSTIINSGSQSVFYNISGQDNLQILNSTIITNGTMSINYGQTSSVISSNSVTNKNFIINNIYGNINILDSLIF